MTGAPRSARDRAMQYDADNVDFLAYRVRVLQRLAGLRAVDLKRLVADDGDYSIQQQNDFNRRWSNWMNGRTSALKQREYEVIVAHLFDSKLWMHERLSAAIDRFYPDAVFHALAQFMGMTPAQIAEDAAGLTGVYNAYCFVHSSPGEVAVGRLTIAVNPDSRAITTLEEYDLTPPGGLPGPKHAYDGYLIRTAKARRIFARDRHQRPSGEPADTQLTLIPDIQYDDGKVQEMEAVVLHNHRDAFYYVTRTYFRRAEGRVPLETMRLSPPERRGHKDEGAVPDHIVRKLVRPLQTDVKNIWRLT